MAHDLPLDDLEVEVSQPTAGGLEVRILRSPFNRPRAEFTPPFPAGGARRKWEEIDGWIQEYLRAGGDLSKCPPLDLQGLGATLFETLFPEPLRSTLARSEGRSEDRAGLRLRLSFDISPGAVNEAAVLPWELLWSPWADEFFALDPQTPMVRFLDSPEPQRAVGVTPPLRVLLVASNPGKDLDLEKEKQAILQAAEGSSLIEIEILPEPTLSKLVQRLDEEDFHVVHFMGHGNFDDQGGFVLFEAADGGERAVTDRVLASVLSAERSLRLVVLAACEGAQLSRPDGSDTLHGVAAGLFREGLAVIGMQFVISDDAARWFSGAFYGSLLRDGLLETAVTQGRRAIFHQDQHTVEWASPVLFLGVPEGRLLDLSGVSAAEETPEETGERVVGIFSMGRDRYGKDAFERVEHALDLSAFFGDRFDGRYIRTEALWPVVAAEVARFLPGVVSRSQTNLLEMATHLSIAYAAGRSLESMAGYELVVRQRSFDGVHDWRPGEGEAPGELWTRLEERSLDGRGEETALAITVSQKVTDSVVDYLGASDLPVGRLLVAGMEEGQLAIESGRHAFELAQELFQWVRDVRAGGKHGPLHLFLSGPVGFAFFLGRLTRDWGEVQLYEHDRDGRMGSVYFPSLRVGGGE